MQDVGLGGLRCFLRHRGHLSTLLDRLQIITIGGGNNSKSNLLTRFMASTLVLASEADTLRTPATHNEDHCGAKRGPIS
jgi:hypothetical protein